MRSLRTRLGVLIPLLGLALAPAAIAQSGGTSAPAPGSNPSTAVLNGGTSAHTGGGTSSGSLPGGTAPSNQTENGSTGGVRSGGTTPSNGTEAPPTATDPTAGNMAAVLLPNGKARAPKNAPLAVKRAIRAANKIIKKPYVYGGGHARWDDVGYDCSGAVSYALRGAKLLTSPLTSGDFMEWGDTGAGKWITTYANENHMFVVIAGLRLDTGAPSERGPRWRTTMRPTGAFTARHPRGL